MKKFSRPLRGLDEFYLNLLPGTKSAGLLSAAPVALGPALLELETGDNGAVISAGISALAKRAATDVGFDLCGIAPVSESDLKELSHFPSWIDAGYAGEMDYLKARDERGELKRAALGNVAPWARSVIVCAINYNTAQPYSTEVTNDQRRGWIARYAWSAEDYHESVLRRLRQVETKLKQACPQDDLITRCYVDTGPLVERVYAKYAGIGWVGKNTCILNQELGSWLFLGVILTSIDLRADFPALDRCGTCTRCIDACPTGALVGAYKLDSTQCISYLTIEKRGSIPEDLRSDMGNHIFGCDICQDVCPWNNKPTYPRTAAEAGLSYGKPPATTAAEFQPRPALVNPELAWIAEMGREEFRQTFRHSPVKRAKYSGLRRNAAIAMGNSGDPSFASTLAKLSLDPDAIVSEHARWALQKLQNRDDICAKGSTQVT